MLVSLSYKARSGKDTIADYLVQNYGFVKMSFAESLKKASKEIFSFSEEQVNGNLKEVVDPYWNQTPRYILQKVGTELFRNYFDKEIWVRSLEARIKRSDSKNICITDTRFPNEVDAVKRWGGKLIKVVRDVVPEITGVKQHESEIALESYTGWDYIVYNNGTFEDLYRKIDNLISLIK